MMTQSFLYWLKVCCHSFTASGGNMSRSARLWLKKLAWHCFFALFKNVKPLPGDTQANSQPRWWMRERLPLPWKLARSLLSKQMRVSWCGLSFPLSWRCYSTKVWGLWERPVRARGEEMCIYLCWWGTTSTLICLQSSVRISSQASEAVRSPAGWWKCTG